MSSLPKLVIQKKAWLLPHALRIIKTIDLRDFESALATQAEQQTSLFPYKSVTHMDTASRHLVRVNYPANDQK